MIKNKMSKFQYPNDAWGTFHAEEIIEGVHKDGLIDINLFTDDVTGDKYLSLYPVDENGQINCQSSLAFYKVIDDHDGDDND